MDALDYIHTDNDPDWGSPAETLEITFGEEGRYAYFHNDANDLYIWPEPSDCVQIK